MIGDRMTTFTTACYAKDIIRRALRLLKSRTYEAVADWFMEEGRRYVAVLTLHFWRRKFA